jgi:hypothetical protein
VIDRKNSYMPCIISDRFDSLTPAEQAKLLRDTYSADNITNAEWPVVLRHEGVKRYVKSKFKKKAVGWVMALSRLIRINPELAVQALREADAMYREQVEEDPPIPWARLADLIGGADLRWEGSSLDHWLKPLCKLRVFHPTAHAAVVARFTGEEGGEETVYVALPTPCNTNEEGEG